MEEATSTVVQEVRSPGQTFWEAGSSVSRPLQVIEGVGAIRSGGIAVGLVGPGQIAFPVPGVPLAERAAADFVAITEVVAREIDPTSAAITIDVLVESVQALIESAHNLGNSSLPQRLASVLLQITEMTGQPVVNCRQDILAMAAAARRESVATILSKWREEEWIVTRYRRTRILDRDQLTAIRDGYG